MKAVVVEIKNRYVAVLSDDGCIVKIKNNNYEIGQVIQMSRSKIHMTKKIAAFAASVAAMVILSTGTWAYASPYSYVSLDVNPSIEFTVNRFDRVLKVRATNDDGTEFLKEVNLNDLKNETIKEALSTTVEQISQAGYFEGNIEAGLVIATSAKNEKKAEDLAKELQETVDTDLVESGQEVQVESFKVGYERVQKAKELGVTPGKLNLVEKLQESATDPTTIDIEEWLNKPVKEIMKATKANRKALSSNDPTLVEDTDIDADDIIEVSEKELKEAIKEERKEQKAAEKAEKDAKKATEKAEKEAEKTAKKVEKEAEKAAKKAEKEAEKAAKKVANKAKEKNNNKQDKDKATNKKKDNTNKLDKSNNNLKGNSNSSNNGNKKKNYGNFNNTNKNNNSNYGKYKSNNK